MEREVAYEELEKYVITSISSEEIKHININVAKRVVDEVIEHYENRICDTCKHCKVDEDLVFHCSKSVADGSDDTNYQVADFDIVESGFGCNKWEEI